MRYPNIQKQHGVTLIVSLVILVTMTLLGITSMQRTTMELTMAGNQRESGLMFQAAEIGIDSAEDTIAASTSNGYFNDENSGLYTVAASSTSYTGPDYFSDTDWKTKSQSSSTSINAKEQPRYLIEYLGDRYQNVSAVINIGGYGTQQTGDIVSIYRTTSRGAGLTGNAYRYIQSYYGKDAP